MTKFIVRQLQSDPKLAELEIPLDLITDERLDLDQDLLDLDAKVDSGEYIEIQEDILVAETKEFVCKANKYPISRYQSYGVLDIEETRYVKEGIYIVDETWTFDSQENALTYIEKFRGDHWFDWTGIKVFLTQNQIYQQYLYIDDSGKQAEINI